MSQLDDSARAYWTEQLELGYGMVEELLTFPVEECGEGFASIPDAADAAGVEMQFSESKIAGDLDRVFFIRESLVDDVIAIGRVMNDRGWILKVEDGFRSREMQRTLVRKPAVFDLVLQKCIWENGGEMPPVEFVFRRAIVLVANIPKIGTHMSGSAIDISVFRRDDGSEVWRGGPYLEVSEKTPMRSPFITEDELQNRLAITEIMESKGFMHFPYEFWHFNKGDAGDHILNKKPEPARYGPVDWNRETNEVQPMDNPMDPLNPLEQIEIEIAAAMKRL
ncbi:M15 family metallopeptidase [Thalassoglobus polymorphus]|uniref:D-alanyl-D-alanine dipeptidase n=1 Tax=Thalassoglobus polymorphus TaxID=2527994 RepID=A0A517QSB6_9PLAN|nr:M15 family metallopeptidase [Thalassoglobus polymorphus]QDT34518.1 D-alanyl-D-alanine dipeptidase [Thalassoglobus polymorphus]